MSQKYLGKTFDMHTGGIDNMFPHHEDEIAQSECANGCKFVNYWLHCEHLTVNKQKMSKSLGNFYTVRDLLEQGYSGREIRWTLIGTHYRAKLNFDISALGQARTALRKFASVFERLNALPEGSAGREEAQTLCNAAHEKFGAAFANDLNAAEGLAEVFKFNKEVISLLVQNKIEKEAAVFILNQYRDFDRILGCLDVDAAVVKKAEAAETEQNNIQIPAEIQELVSRRIAAKKAKDFQTADSIREQLKQSGWIVKDTAEGVKVSKI